MYVVLQGIGSPSCMIIIYVIPFGEQQFLMSEVRKLERFNKKTAPPKWSISFHIVLKNEFFKLTEGYLRPVSENYEKRTILQWKLMDLGGIPSKIDEYFHWGPIFYVCSFASNRVPFMYNYYIHNSLWGAAILDVWSPQKTGPPKWFFFKYIELKKWVFQAHRRVSPTTGVGKLWPNTYFCNESQ